jgi:hypothetical protein
VNLTPRTMARNTGSQGQSRPQNSIFLSAFENYQTIDLQRGSFNDASGRVVVPNEEIQHGRTGIFLVFGQSNGANSGEAPYSPRQRVLNFNIFDGYCYIAMDPLLGATEQKGNFASRLADKLIERDLFDTVVITPIAVGGSRIEEWTTGGSRHRRLQVAIRRIQDAGLAFTHLLWHQGETNAGYDPDYQTYVDSFMNIHAALHSYGVTAPLYVAQASVCRSPPCEIIRAAQRAVVDPTRGILAGPDTDLIGIEHRYDGCHMAESGLIMHADLWLEVLSSNQTCL